MGYVKADIQIKNPRYNDLLPVNVTALVDTGALMLCIPEHLQIQLRLEELEKREITTADGRKQLVPYVGPLQLSFANRNCFVAQY